MQKGKCPNCGKHIPLLSAGDMDEHYGITPNVLQHAKEMGNFPDPWISFGNRAVYLKSDIEAYAKDRARAKTDKTVAELRSLLDALPESERDEAIQSLTASDKGAVVSRRRTKA